MKEYAMLYAIGRHVNGCTLNGLEFVLKEENGPMKLFTKKEDAIAFLKKQADTDPATMDADLENGALIIVEVADEA